MENRRQKSTSGDTFSFPSTPIHEQDSDFEFGCFTPDSASSTDPCKDSPADHLFFNGRLLPHAFPFQPISNGFMGVDSNSQRTSRTSSISSKDSLMSSRSNSTNSRSSSARTSSSDNSERKLVHQNKLGSRASSDRYKGNRANNLGAVTILGRGRKWISLKGRRNPSKGRENSGEDGGGPPEFWPEVFPVACLDLQKVSRYGPVQQK
ncbi:hypothetical protein GBA52_007152 [Prunus armeniaca]|nr:hypothetical protein GBA52_007152 [Prunus armeniaca]